MFKFKPNLVGEWQRESSSMWTKLLLKYKSSEIILTYFGTETKELTLRHGGLETKQSRSHQVQRQRSKFHSLISVQMEHWVPKDQQLAGLVLQKKEKYKVLSQGKLTLSTVEMQHVASHQQNAMEFKLICNTG